MNVEVFLDTNILVYAAAGRGPEERKRQRAVDLMESQDFGISAQVLQEFFVTIRRKIANPLSAIEALEWIEQLRHFPCQPIDQTVVRMSIEISERYTISYWDAAIIVAATALGAHTVYSEDLNSGLQYGRLRVVNPFSTITSARPS